VLHGRHPVEDDELALEFAGLRFRDPSTERDFGRWFAAEAVRYVRLATLSSAVGWFAGYLALGIGIAGTFGESSWWLFGAIVPLFGVLYLSTLLPGRQMLVISAVANAIGGVIAVWPISFHTADSPALGGLVTVLFAFFAFTIFRLPPLIGGAAALTYTAVHQVLVLNAHSDGQIDNTDAVVESAIPWLAFVVGLLISCVLMRLSREAYRRERVIEQQGRIIAAERERSDILLRNVLPDVVAEQLKNSTEPIADYFDEVTVLFADICGFTELATRVPPRDLVDLLNEVFSTFDALTVTRDVEKIKTIGDAYMAVAGVPVSHADHAATMADLALDMRDSLRDIGQRTRTTVACRFGLATGPAVAGVIGRNRFAYDLWGNTVNMAARMESHGEIGRIQVTAAVRDALAHTHVFTERGEIEVKGAGLMQTWFLESRRRD
jgi:class 3 adenylate cyclase